MNFEEEQLNKIVSSIAIILNNDHSIKAINSVGLKILKKTGRQLIGKTFNPQDHPFTSEESENHYFSNTEWSRLIDVIPMPVFVKDREHRWILFNEALCQLQNMTRDQLLNKTDYDFFSKNQADKFWKEEEVIFETSKGIFTEEPSTRNGQESYVLIKKALFRTDSGEDYLVGCCIDITERKKAELALVESERRFRSLIQNSPDLIIILDNNTCVKYVTPSFERLLGYPQTEILGISLVKLVHTEDVAGFLTFFSKVSNFSKDVTAEFRLKKRSGSYIILESSFKNLYYDPAVNGIVINASNITTLRKQAKEIEKMNSLLQKDNFQLQVELRHEVEARAELKLLLLEDFKKLYADDDACLSYLASQKWRDGFTCTKCYYTKFSEGKLPHSRRCTKCGYDESATTNTFYYRCKFSLLKAFYMVSLVRFDRKITAKKLAELTNLRMDTCASFKRRVLALIFKEDKLLPDWESLIISPKIRNRKARRASQ